MPNHKPMSKSELIRRLTKTGRYSRTEIARMTNAHYQMVRNVQRAMEHAANNDTYHWVGDIIRDPPTSAIYDLIITTPPRREIGLYEEFNLIKD